MQAFELTILNWIQAHLRCGVLDAVMVPVSRICDHGEVWILLAAILLAIPKTRKLGTCVACGLVLDLLFCNLALKPLIGRMRPFAVSPGVSLLIPPPFLRRANGSRPRRSRTSPASRTVWAGAHPSRVPAS